MRPPAGSPLPWSPPASDAKRLYSDTSPWNQPIQDGTPVEPGSLAMVRGLTAARNRMGFPVAVREWTVPTYIADRDTPRHTVELRRAPPGWTSFYGTPSNFIGAPPGWATDPVRWRARTGDRGLATPSVMRDVPIPEGAEADGELDGHMTVLDPASGCEYDFYAAHRGATGWQAVWANSTRMTGSGIYPEGLSSKASGFAGAAGLIRPEELRAGRIDHALFVSIPNTKSGGPVFPATSSDGKTNSDEAIPQGARIRLDPDLDLESLRLKPYEKIVAKALQEYGMIVGDTGGTISLFAVHPKSYPSNPYRGLLPDDAYAYLDRIPTSSFQVMKLPAQRRDLALNLHPTGCASPE